MASTLGYTVVRSAPNFIGRLKPSQLHMLFDGFSKTEKKKSDGIKNSGKKQAGMHDLHKVPGVKVLKRK